MRTPVPMANASNTDRSAVDWLRLIVDGLPALLAWVVLGTAGALIYTATQADSYQATETVVVSSARGFLDPQNADQLPALTDTVARLAQSAPVLEKARQKYIQTPHSNVAARRASEATRRWLGNHVTTIREANSSILRVQARAPTQLDANDLAQANGDSLARVVNRASASESPNPAKRTTPTGIPTAGLRITAFSVKDDGQVSPTLKRNLILGVNAGILLGLVSALALGARRRRLWRREEIEDALDLPVVAVVQRARRGRPPRTGSLNVVGRLLTVSRNGGGSRRLLVTGPAREGSIQTVARGLADALGPTAQVISPSESRRDPERPKGTSEPSGPATSWDAEAEASPERAGVATKRRDEHVNEHAASASVQIQIVADEPLRRGDEFLDRLAATDSVLVVAERGSRSLQLERTAIAARSLGDDVLGAVLVL